MAYFAKIEKGNNVTNVIAADQDHIDNIKVVSEAVEAAEAVEAVLWADGDELPEGKEVGDVKVAAVGAVEAQEAVYDTWIETKMDGSIRKNYAGIGYTYDSERDAFIPPKQQDARRVLNDDTCRWDLETPEVSWLKAEIQAYMDTMDISYEQGDSKSELIEKIG